MPIVSRGGEEDKNERAASGAPPGFDIDFDPNDPDQVNEAIETWLAAHPLR